MRRDAELSGLAVGLDAARDAPVGELSVFALPWDVEAAAAAGLVAEPAALGAAPAALPALLALAAEGAAAEDPAAAAVVPEAAEEPEAAAGELPPPLEPPEHDPPALAPIVTGLVNAWSPEPSFTEIVMEVPAGTSSTCHRTELSVVESNVLSGAAPACPPGTTVTK